MSEEKVTSVDDKKMTPEEKAIWLSAFGWSSAWGHKDRGPKLSADHAVRHFRELFP